ncbi:HTH domain-containing protein [Haloarcula sp. GH36]|uniref:HTH domain-containing protein n=1 Tax=Haloarcula montana TaxID=3111776 RepID=UPI002D767B5D|nr:HTH domain-containing protein [Haloarcula sp. GH36]
MESTQSDDRRAELFVRSLLPEASRTHQQSVVDRVRALVDDGRLLDHSVTVWGKQLPAAPTETETAVGRLVHERVRTFKRWATANDRSLSPAFSIRTVDGQVLDEQYRALVLPQLLLVEYDGESVQCVTPHATEDCVVSVTNRLERLETGTAATFTHVEQSGVESSADRIEVLGGTIGDHDPVVSE